MADVSSWKSAKLPGIALSYASHERVPVALSNTQLNQQCQMVTQNRDTQNEIFQSLFQR